MNIEIDRMTISGFLSIILMAIITIYYFRMKTWYSVLLAGSAFLFFIGVTWFTFMYTFIW